MKLKMDQEMSKVAGVDSKAEAERKLSEIEKVCREAEGGGMASIGACAAVRAMAHHWRDHFLEDFGWEIVDADIKDALAELERVRMELLVRSGSPGRDGERTVESGMAQAH